MPQNVGSIDRAIRLMGGIALVFGGTVMFHNLLITVLGLGIFLTGVIKFCGIYKLLGISTHKPCKLEDKPKEGEGAN